MKRPTTRRRRTALALSGAVTLAIAGATLATVTPANGASAASAAAPNVVAAGPGSDATVVSKLFDVAPGKVGDATVACPVGSRATGGGVLGGAAGPGYMQQSGPVDETGTFASTKSGDIARGWSVSVFNPGDPGVDQKFHHRLSVICSASSDATITANPFTVEPRTVNGALTLVAAVAAVSVASAAPPPWMSDESSYDVLTYSAWGRQNGLTGAECTGIGKAGRRPGVLGATHGSFRCQTQVGGTPSAVVVARVLGPQWLRVVSITGGKVKPDRGIGPVPKGPPTLQNFDALSALQNGPWGKAHKISRALCYGVGSYQDRTGSQYYYAFSCATFDSQERRGAQVLVTAAGKNAVRVVRTLAR